MAKCNRKQRLLGKSIRRIRMRRNMTQRELANAAGLGEAVFRFFTNGYRREHGTEPKVTGNRKLSESDILSGMGAVSVKIDS